MRREEERWAEATAVYRMYRDHADVHIAERIAALATAGDQAGIDRWREIALRLDQLMGQSLQ